MATCPNKSHPDYKVLEARYGERGAMRKYMENGNEIPVPENVSKRIGYDKNGNFFKSRDTLQSMESNPQLTAEIIDSLQRLYPNVKIYKDGIVDKDGNFVEIATGEKGMHYRNAFQGAVAWANDAYMETPPHEYAHEYVDMFREIPIVKKGIEKYGEEQLVQRMGSYYAGRKMSSSFENFVKDFWASIKSLLGSPDIADVLSKNFYEGNMLEGPVHQGTAITRYQTAPKVFKATNGGVNSDGKYDKLISNAEEISEEDALTQFVKIASSEEAVLHNENDPARVGKPTEVNENKLHALINRRQRQLVNNDQTRDGDYMNSPNTDTRLLSDTSDVLKSSESLQRIGQALLGIKKVESAKMSLDGKTELMPEREVPLIGEELKAFNTIVAVEKRLDYIRRTRDSFYDSNGKLVPKGEVIESIDNEISETAKRRKALYDKIPSKQLKWMFSTIENALASFQLNARLVAKYLSGAEDSELSDMVYKALDQADGKKLSIMFGFTDIFTGTDNIPGYSKWSLFNKQGSDINDLETIGIKTDSGEVKLTKAEYLSMYMTLRQADSRSTLMESGFILDQSVKGREDEFNKTFKFVSSEANKIKETVEADSEMMQVVDKMDAALDYMYDATNPTFKQEQGYDLEKRKDYFPVFTGKETITQRRSKSGLDQWRAGNARMGQDKPLRIGDAIGIMSNVKNSGSTYAAYALPISNLRKLMSSISDKYEGKQEEAYLKSIAGVINVIESPGELFNSEAEKGFTKWVNTLTSNFAVSVLGMNLAVMAKQPVSYITAMEEINKRYLKRAGWGIGGVVGISPMEIFRSLSYTGVKAGDTVLPIEWAMDKENDIYKEMMKSPKMRARLEGMVSKETGEALMNAEIGKDKIKLPGKYKGESVYISKARLMEGIKVFDSVTIMSIWKAVKFEMADEQKGLVEGTPEYQAHLEGRVNDIVNKTQPTYDAANRSLLSLSKNPIARVLTMFSSARSKVAMLMVDSIISTINNSSPENKRKLYKRSLNVGVTTAVTLSIIDMIKGGVLYGMDDDDDLVSGLSMGVITTNMGYLYGISNLSSLVLSQVDDKPWHKNMQHPFEGMVQETSEALSHIYKGNFDKALFKSMDVAFKVTGLPGVTKTYPKALATRLLEE